MKPKVPPPATVWVSFCARCGTAWCADPLKWNAVHSSGGCDCPVTRTGAATTAVAKYVLAPPAKRGRRT